MQRPLHFDGRFPDLEVSLMASAFWLRALSSWTRKLAPLRRSRPRARLGVETLEDRTVPSTFTYQAVGTTPVSLVLTDNNQSIQVRNGSTNAVLASAPLATTTAVQITGAAAQTSLTVAEDAHLNILPISFAGQSGSDSLTITDHTSTKGEVNTLDAGALALSSGGQVTWSSVATITVNGNGGGNTFNVQGTDNGASIILNTGSGNDAVNIGDSQQTLEEFLATLTINGQGGTNTVTFNDQGELQGNPFHSTQDTWYAAAQGAPASIVLDHYPAGVVGRPGYFGVPTTVNWQNVQQFVLNDPAGGSSSTHLFNPNALTGTHLTINGQTLNDTIESVVATKQTFTVTGLNSGTVGNISYSGVNYILGGGNGTTTFKFLPGGYEHALNGNGTAVLDLSAFTPGTPVTLPYNANSGLYPVGSFPASTPNGVQTTGFIAIQTIIGAANDTLIGPAKPNVWNISGPNQGQVDDGVSFSGFPNLQGGGVSDSFQFTSARGATRTVGQLTGSIVGGGGVTTLDYSGHTGNVTVDLPLGVASLVGGGVSGIQNVVGSVGNDILVGNGGNRLTGGAYSSLLIAGPTPSTLVGQGDEDILVGGTTAYDTNLTALQAIMAEWTRTDLSYSARVNHLLSGGGKNGSTVLNPSTFSTNGGHNTLNGGAGLDLFYGFQTLETTDYNPGLGEIFINDATFGHTRIDVNNLSVPLVLDNSQVLNNGFTPYLTLSPGTHTLTQEFTNNSVQFTVAADGTVNYDPSLNGVLSGQGTTTLVVNGATITVDATALQADVPYLRLNGVSPVESTSAPFSITVLPGPDLFAQAYTNNSVQFNVLANGTVTYDPSLEGVLTGTGTSTLTIHGVTVTVDATALQADVPYLRLNGVSPSESTSAPFPITVLPGPNSLAQAFTNDAVLFNVGNDGTITWGPSLNGVLTSNGPNSLTIHGVAVTVDATALQSAVPSLTLNTASAIEPTNAPFTITVLPGPNTLAEYGSNNYVQFTVNPDGTISYDPSLQGILTTSGPNMLTIHGETLEVDATALSQQDSTFSLDGFGAFSTAQVQFFQVLPGGNYSFQAGTTSMQFSLDAMDQLSFATIYDAIATGRGTNTLTLL
jgi:hypothetical protein